MKGTLLFLVLTVIICITHTLAQAVPEQVHIAIYDESSSVSISWFINGTDSNSPLSSSVQLRTDTQNYPTTTGSANAYSKESGWSGFVHTVILTNLQPNTVYYYKCGSQVNNMWSEEYSFQTMFTFKQGPNLGAPPVYFGWYGDMGFANASELTLQSVNRKREAGMLDVIFHIGDIAYCDFDSEKQGHQLVWGEFLNEIKNVSTTTPYMVCPGNHDVFYDGNPYLTTFPNPSGLDMMWYAFTYQNIRFISISLETWMFPFSTQRDWLVDQLKSHTSDPNRPPWLIVYSHRPYYCSNAWEWCSSDPERKIAKFELEDIFQEYGVDIYLGGHTHSYERTFPVYKDEVRGDYATPGATVHLVVGNSGAQESLDMDWQTTPEWSAYHTSSLGWGYMTVWNDTHIQWQMIFSENNTVADEFWLQKGQFSSVSL